VWISCLGCSALLLLCFGSRCLSSLDPDISLCSSHCVLFAALLDSWLLLNLLFSCSSCFLCWCRAYWY
jgi:hypothetical protein